MARGFCSEENALSVVTISHRLILPVDANHHGTLYAGSLLRLALEAAYATSARTVGEGANVLLRRVLNIECYRPVHVGQVVEIHGLPLHLTRAYMVIGLIGMPTEGKSGPWMDGLMGFVQVDDKGRLCEFPRELALPKAGSEWSSLKERMDKLLKLRVRNGKKVSGEW
jgi:acyl-CoA thioesterase YciA